MIPLDVSEDDTVSDDDTTVYCLSVDDRQYNLRLLNGL